MADRTPRTVAKTVRIEGCTVWTGLRQADGSIRTTDAVLVRDGRIVALGATARAVRAGEVVDGAGGFLAPAFGDGHVHALFGGLEQQLAPVRDASNPQEIAAAVGRWAREHPEATWVRGEGFDHTLAPGGIFLASWLDAEVLDRPVVLRATDYHTVWVNSEALRRAGYGVGVVQPHDGEIVLDGNGAPTGTLREWGAWRPVYDLLPEVPKPSRIAALRYASDCFASAGLTWVQDAWVEHAEVTTWLEAYQAGALAFGADLALWCDPNSWRDQLVGFQESRDRVDRDGGGQLTARTIKFFADGVVESGTAAMLEPYCDCPHSRGLPNWDPQELKEAVSAIDALGFTAHIHAIGDAGVRNALDALEGASRLNPTRDRRWVMAHTQLVAEADLPRFAELGVIANFEPYWSKWDAWQYELSEPRLGTARTNRQFQTATLLRSGAPVSFGSDWPVTTYAPLDGIQVAVTRQVSTDAPAWVPEECVSVDEALLCYTAGVAFQAGRDDAGVIRPGAVADLVLLGADPRRVSAMEIDAIPVRGTWRAGLRTHEGH